MRKIFPGAVFCCGFVHQPVLAGGREGKAAGPHLCPCPPLAVGRLSLGTLPRPTDWDSHGQPQAKRLGGPVRVLSKDANGLLIPPQEKSSLFPPLGRLASLDEASSRDRAAMTGREAEAGGRARGSSRGQPHRQQQQCRAGHRMAFQALFLPSSLSHRMFLRFLLRA